jgi:cobalt-precorrin-7 (C5)-methyltransferase
MIYVVGAGPGNRKYLTTEALDIIQQADVVIAFGRIAETVEPLTSHIVRVKRVDEVVQHVRPEQHIAILASGDPGFYGILEYLKKQHIIVDRVVPGISSFQYMMASLKKSWQGARFFSLHGREEDLTPIQDYPLTVILTDKQNTPDSISKRLQRLGFGGRLYVGYNLSYDDEYILEAEIGDDIEARDTLSVVVVEQQ